MYVVCDYMATLDFLVAYIQYFTSSGPFMGTLTSFARTKDPIRLNKTKTFWLAFLRSA